MIHTIYDQDTGRARAVVSGHAAVFDPHVTSGRDVYEGYADPEAEYFVDDAPAPRPATGLPETHTLAPSTDWTISPIPEGMAYQVLNINGGVIASGTMDDAEALTVNFAAASTYYIALGGFFPWQDGFCTVTVA